jgi:glyoxylase-like metal-dependent hydrolase (beta-lactamase superfamily II)
MIEIVPGIYQINLPLSGYPTASVNVYLVRGTRSHFLIDAGWNSDMALNSLRSQLEAFGIGLTDVKDVIVTHCHHDHYDMTSHLKRSHGARIYLHRADLEIIQARARGHRFLNEMDAVLRSHGVPDSELATVFPKIPDLGPPVLPDVLLEGGEHISVGDFTLQIIWTPGHTPGQISLYEPNRKLLFPSDLVMPTMACSTSLHLQYSRNPLKDYLNSLQELRRLDVRMVLPGHEHVFSNLAERIDDLIERRSRKDRRILEALAIKKSMTAHDLAVTLSYSSRSKAVRWPEMTSMDRRFAVSETISHLQALEYAGRIERTTVDGRIAFSPA